MHGAAVRLLWPERPGQELLESIEWRAETNEDNYTLGDPKRTCTP